jgi:hypothetical protein
MSDTAHVLWAIVAAYAVWRFAAVVECFAPHADADEVEVPEDLVALAMTHTEGWAQEDTLKAMRERYDQLRDWNRVRAAFGVGRIDEA